MKKVISLVLALVLLVSAATTALAAKPAAAETEFAISDALYSLGLFLGTGKQDGIPTYNLGGTLTRAHAIVLLVRMLGKEAEALNGTFSHPFTDTASWYDAHVGYGYANGYTKGTGAKTYSGGAATNAKMFTTFCLRALGYADKASADAAEGDFWWADAPAFAEAMGIRVSKNSVYTRADAVQTFWDVLRAKVKGSEQTLAEKLIAEGVFTAEQYQTAQKIAAGEMSLFTRKAASGTNELPEMVISVDSSPAAPEQKPADTTPSTPAKPSNPSADPFELPAIDIA